MFNTWYFAPVYWAGWYWAGDGLGDGSTDFRGPTRFASLLIPAGPDPSASTLEDA